MTRYEATAMFEGRELMEPEEGTTEQEALDMARSVIADEIPQKAAWVRKITEFGLPADAIARHTAELNELQNCVYRVREVTYGEWR